MKTWMHYIMLTVAAVLLIAEAYAVINVTAEDTVSEVVRAWNRWSGGLIALLMLAVWWHWFGWLPNDWR